MTKKLKKTFEMKSADVDTWLAALRSGKYKQGINELYSEKTHYTNTGNTNTVATYCCLGVMQDCLGKVQKGKGLPTVRWLKDHNITKFIVVNDSVSASEGDIPINPINGKHGAVYDTLSKVNDSGKYSFKQIAQIIERNVKRV